MGRLYIFAIGGTGARVLKSLGNLLASGIQIEADEIIPMIIDTDDQNADTIRTEDLLKSYRSLRQSIPSLQKSFFHNKIVSIGDLARQNGDQGWGTNFVIKLKSTTGQTLKDYIDYDYIVSPQTKSMLDLLYSNNNFNDPLTYGFLGSPNVGCVVLDELVNTPEFKHFGNIVTVQDRVFIISSIFGGTGAAGFPLLLNNFIPGVGNIVNQEAISRIPIGAISVLPYFTLNDNPSSRIESSAFYTKSISALNYYQNNLSRVNMLYYIGDSDPGKAYVNVQGGKEQKNDANFVEIAAAMSIVDFMKHPSGDLINNNLFREFAVKNNSSNLLFSDLGDITNKNLASNICLLKMADLFSETMKSQTMGTFMGNNRLFDSFFNENFYASFRSYIEIHYSSWLNELSLNQRGFSPFGDNNRKNLTGLINGKRVPNVGLFGKTAIGENNFVKECSKILSQYNLPQERFIDLLFRGTSAIYTKHIKNIVEA
jgi:hypothetical protein